MTADNDLPSDPSNDSSSASSSGSGLAVFCRADARGRLDADWLSRLRAELPEATLLARPAAAEAHGLEAVDADPDNRASLRAALPERLSDAGLLVIRTGLVPPACLARRLTSLAASPDCPPWTVLPGNYDGRVNPLAGTSIDAEGELLDSLAAACGRRGWVALNRLPLICAYARPPRPGDGSVDAAPAGLVDDFFVLDPTRALDEGKPDASTRAALGPLRAGLLTLTETSIDRLPLFGHDRMPVTLHVTHAWGGGIARWISDQCRHDRLGHHLVLCASAERDAAEYGQRLELFAQGPDCGRLQRFMLAPPIADTVDHHPGYAACIEWLVARYGVSRVVVSSLIGHSLDCLRTGLPTAQVLHDFYPATPVLDRDPLDDLGSDGHFSIDRALEQSRGRLMFETRSARHWSSLRERWREAVDEHAVRLIAPTEHVADRWQRLFDGALEAIDVIGHARPPGSGPSEPVRPRARDDGRLTLVVIGRLSSVKGLALLEAAAGRLTRLARIVLVGAGRNAEDLFGYPGIDVILDFSPDELPGLIARIGPDAALFLSTVPETWNYVLSEVRELGIPPLATDLGAFAERIEHGHDGVLFAPSVDGLVGAVEYWAEHRERLAELAANAPDEPVWEEVMQRYHDLLPGLERSAVAVPPFPENGLESGRYRAEWVDQRQALQRASSERKAAQAELDRRADWALRQQRLAAERTRWARSLEQEAAHLRDELIGVQADLGRLQADNARLTRERDAASLYSEQLQNHLELVLRSRSWRLTRPLRFGQRLVGQLAVARAWNPLTWPALARACVTSLRTRGLRDSLMAIHAQQMPGSAPPGVVEAAESDPAELTTPVVLAPVEKPRASIVIPVYNGVELTAACLHSIARIGARTPFEVVVVDDYSSDGSADFLAACEGIRVARNEVNSGFIDTCNHGASLARGEFLVFLNNDTTVTPGWLDALVAVFDRDPAAGVVGARLVYPDGRLQEAGGIIFNDASGWNYGRDQRPDEPQYGFVSEADYVSGACLAIRRAEFERLGGFDTRYRPAYYEDTDLCFKVREAGGKVVYQPAATVVHYEGATSGTDESSGAKRYQAINREKFHAKWSELLADHPPPAPDPSRADPVRAQRFRRQPRRLLLIDAVTPRPDHDSGSVRVLAMMKLFRDLGYQVSFMPENRVWVSGYSDALTQAGIEVLHAPAVSSVEGWLREHGRDLDLVIVSRHYVLAPLLKLIRHHCPEARLVFDTVDLHFLREQREAELTEAPAMAAQARATRKQELGLIRRADITLVVSPVEQELLASEAPGADVRVVSNIHTVHGCQQGFEARRGLLFVGGFQHLPNQDAARWLIDEIFPRVRRELPDIELHLIGSQMPADLLETQQPGIRVHGFVPDIDPFLGGCRVSLAPLRYGAGVKGKVNQAMSHGLPVVATPCAAEGMFLDHGVDVYIGEDAPALAAGIVRVYTERELWERLSSGGLANVEKHFSEAAARHELARIDELADR